MDLPIRKNTRLKTYDYSTEGGYFITICTENRKCILSEVEDGNELRRASIHLTKLGYIARDTMCSLEERYNIQVDSYVIMPNHIHMILLLKAFQDSKTIGQLVGAYKSLVAKQWRDLCNAHGITAGTIWQRNYYEHILRNKADYLEKARYIDENPDQWHLDEYAAIR